MAGLKVLAKTSQKISIGADTFRLKVGIPRIPVPVHYMAVHNFSPVSSMVKWNEKSIIRNVNIFNAAYKPKVKMNTEWAVAVSGVTSVLF